MQRDPNARGNMSKWCAIIRKWDCIYVWMETVIFLGLIVQPYSAQTWICSQWSSCRLIVSDLIGQWISDSDRQETACESETGRADAVQHWLSCWDTTGFSSPHLTSNHPDTLLIRLMYDETSADRRSSCWCSVTSVVCRFKQLAETNSHVYIQQEHARVLLPRLFLSACSHLGKCGDAQTSSVRRKQTFTLQSFKSASANKLSSKWFS